MKLHFWSGYAILTLLLFRIAWGFVGSTTARFSDFVKGPSAGLALSAGPGARADAPTRSATIRWAAAWSWCCSSRCWPRSVAGLFSADTDTGTVNGPLANLIADKWVDRLTHFHHFWVNVLLVLVALHVLAAVVYLVWKRQNLIGAMFTGHKPLDDVVPPGQACAGAALRARAGWRCRC